ncbi:MAG: hypothetical protein AAF799_06320 [Myxococcota bacterium]
MNKTRALQSLIAAALGSTALVACDAPEDGTSDVDALEQKTEDLTDLVARVELDGGVAVEFRELASGELVVSEVGPAEQASALTFLAVQHHATPLEIFATLAPQQAAPEALRLHHGDVTDDAPRTLSTQPMQFRSTVGWEYATSCAYASDGPWFDDLADSLGWNWKWYFSGSFGNSFPWHKNTPSVDASGHVSHVCNYSITGGTSPGMSHYLYNNDDPGDVWGNTGILPGYRSVSYTLGAGDWRAQASRGFLGATGGYKLGAIAP